jgi:hypothetical protein
MVLILTLGVSYPCPTDEQLTDPRRSVWIPGQGVKIDYAAIIEILVQQLDGERK